MKPPSTPTINPARSTGPALVVGGWALQQLWLFWVAPQVGGLVSGLAYRALAEDMPTKPAITGEAESST